MNKLQLTYLGFPVYYWFKDNNEHNFFGDGVGNSWSIILKDKLPIMFSGLNK
ncbi:COG4315 family predicted lipoprotein [Photobacterium leiognathi]|uniref:hypothetical protein n=1 Tax=Photobacterium leiognathi TaxID=553611 RepID=UPI00387E885C